MQSYLGYRPPPSRLLLAPSPLPLPQRATLQPPFLSPPIYHPLNTYPGYTAANRDTHNLCDPSQCEPGSQASCAARRACSVDIHTRLCVLLVVFASSSSSPCLLTKIAVRCSGEPQGPVRKSPGFG